MRQYLSAKPELFFLIQRKFILNGPISFLLSAMIIIFFC